MSLPPTVDLELLDTRTRYKIQGYAHNHQIFFCLMSTSAAYEEDGSCFPAAVLYAAELRMEYFTTDQYFPTHLSVQMSISL